MGRNKIRTDQPSRTFLTPEQHAAQPLTVPCACGCGTLLPPLNRMGKPSVWAVGHHTRGKKPSEETARKLSEAVSASWDARKGGTEPQDKPRRRYMPKERYEAQPLIVPCACGCGTLLPPLNKLGLPSTFAKNHDKRGMKRSDAVKQKMSETRRERAKERRGDTPAKYWERYEDPRYLPWRTAVLQRDNYRCIICGADGEHTQDAKELHAHHIKEWEKFPEYRFDVDNGQTLCYKHHCDAHGRKIKKYGAELEPPQPCACGCGELAKPGRKWINGHSQRGKTLSPATRAKISQSKTKREPQPCVCGCGQLAPVGRKYAPGCKQKPRGAAIKGFLPEESRQKQRQPRSEESRARMRKPKSEAHRAALSEAARRQWADRHASDSPSG